MSEERQHAKATNDCRTLALAVVAASAPGSGDDLGLGGKKMPARGRHSATVPLSLSAWKGLVNADS